MTVALVGSYAVWAATLACTVALIVGAVRMAATLHSCGTLSDLMCEVCAAAVVGMVVLLVVVYIGAGWVQVAVGAVMLVGLPVLLGSRQWRRARRDRESYRVIAERYAASRAADAAAGAGFGDGR